MSTKLQDYIREQSLPENYLQLVERWYMPIANKLACQFASAGSSKTPVGPPLIAISGLQGTGKSTFAQTLTLLLSEHHQLRVANLSLDDFYLTRQQRVQLADTVHPLFITRGVPGTHDISMLQSKIEQLIHAGDDCVTTIPVFDKALDDRLPESDFRVVKGKVDLIFLEGWCLGAPSEHHSSVKSAVNSLEEEEDPEGIWRRTINSRLSTDYRNLFSNFDYMILLLAPCFESVYQWRLLQEQKLAAQSTTSRADPRNKLMDEAQLKRFIQHYERVSRNCLRTLPDRADLILKLNNCHAIESVVYLSE